MLISSVLVLFFHLNFSFIKIFLFSNEKIALFIVLLYFESLIAICEIMQKKNNNFMLIQDKQGELGKLPIIPPRL